MFLSERPRTHRRMDALLGIATDIAAKEINGEMEVAIGNMLESSLDNALLDAADHSAKGVVKGFKGAGLDVGVHSEFSKLKLES